MSALCAPKTPDKMRQNATKGDKVRRRGICMQQSVLKVYRVKQEIGKEMVKKR